MLKTEKREEMRDKKKVMPSRETLKWRLEEIAQETQEGKDSELLQKQSNTGGDQAGKKVTGGD